jgi:hypothetical protein
MDYINATNLTKLRIAYRTLSDVLATDKRWKQALSLISEMIEELEKKV